MVFDMATEEEWHNWKSDEDPKHCSWYVRKDGSLCTFRGPEMPTSLVFPGFKDFSKAGENIRYFIKKKKTSRH